MKTIIGQNFYINASLIYPLKIKSSLLASMVEPWRTFNIHGTFSFHKNDL